MGCESEEKEERKRKVCREKVSVWRPFYFYFFCIKCQEMEKVLHGYTHSISGL